MKRKDIEALAPTSFAIVGINCPNRNQEALPGMPPASYQVKLSVFNPVFVGYGFSYSEFETPDMEDVAELSEAVLVQRVSVQARLDDSKDDATMVSSIIKDITKYVKRSAAKRADIANAHTIKSKDVIMTVDSVNAATGRNAILLEQLKELIEGTLEGYIDNGYEYATPLAEVTSTLLDSDHAFIMSWVDPRTVASGYTHPALFDAVLGEDMARPQKYWKRSMVTKDYTTVRGYPMKVVM